MMGHSVNTLKLNILFGRVLDGDSGSSAAVGELGRGDVANNGLRPGYRIIN
jgi:hypothetical protein